MNDVVKNVALAELAPRWGALCLFERSDWAHADATLISMPLAWPKQCGARRWLISLSEYDFKDVPQHMGVEIEHYAARVQTTSVTEDAFVLLRQAKASHPDHQLVWVCNSAIFEHSGRPMVPATAAMACATTPRSVPQALYDADVGPPVSFGPAVLGDFRQGLLSPSPAPFSGAHFRWMCGLHLLSPAPLPATVVSKLLQVGTLVADTEPKRVDSIVKSSDGVTAWLLTPVRKGI